MNDSSLMAEKAANGASCGRAGMATAHMDEDVEPHMDVDICMHMDCRVHRARSPGRPLRVCAC